GRPGTPGTNDGSVPSAQRTTTPAVSVPWMGTASATRPPAERRNSSAATRRPSATVRPSVAATLAPSDSEPMSAFRSHRNSPSWASDMASTTATADTRTNPTTAAPRSAARAPRGSVKADLVEEPGDDVPQRLAGNAPDQHDQGEEQYRWVFTCGDGHPTGSQPAAGHGSVTSPAP